MTDALFDLAGSSAVLSDDGTYRYSLARWWDPEGPRATFVMLNPSDADADTDDPTIRKCRGFAQRWGCGGFYVVNLFAYRATQPADLWWARAAGVDIVGGPDNDDHIRAAAAAGEPLVAAWGANAAHASRRARHVTDLVNRPWQALSVTNGGHPGHPLMLSYDRPLVPYVCFT